MRVVSAEFVAAMGKKPLVGRLTLADGTIVSDDIQEMRFDSGAGGETSLLTVGSTPAGSLEAVLDRAAVSGQLTGQRIFAELGIQFPEGPQWAPMGEYWITKAAGDDHQITINAADGMAAKLDVPYEALPGIDFSAESGVSAQLLAAQICGRHGISVEFGGLPDYTLRGFDPTGSTDRQIIGWVAALWGRFARISNSGILIFDWYKTTDITITSDDYYDDGLNQSDCVVTTQWVKCYNEILEETLVEGDPDGAQGIYFECPWMTQEILQRIWPTIEGLCYTPTDTLAFFGDIRIELGDMVAMQTLAGDAYYVPAMYVSHDYDGGVKSEISAAAQSASDVYEGPVTREVKRVAARIVKTQKGIEMSVAGVENQVSYLELEADRIQQRVESAEGSIGYLEVTAQELSTQVDGLGGDVTEIKQTAGQVAVTAADADGTLETAINPKEWYARRVNAAGEQTSGFEFDFESGSFVFDSTGKFRSKDTHSYITVEGDSFVLYTRPDESSAYVVIARIGFSRAENGNTYPYLLMGRSDDEELAGKLGLVKMFSNGVYIGNSVPKDSVGAFVGMPGATGTFTDTEKGITYNVFGEEMRYAWIARFG